MDERMIMEQAIQMKRLGRLDEARSLYQRVIDEIPQCDPAYKGLAKVEIGAKRYEQAIRAVLQKIDLGIFFTYQQCAENERMIMLTNAVWNLADVTNMDVELAGKVHPAGEVERMCRTDSAARDVALLAWAEREMFFYLGHCLARMFPSSFSRYAVPGDMLESFENALLGRPSGQDARSSEYAPVFYVSGFLMACANIKSVIPSIEPSLLTRRFDRTLDFIGLGCADGGTTAKKSWFGSILG